MRMIFFLAVLVVASLTTIAQNVGIGTNNPAKAKLEVHGVAGSGATSAIFGGDGAGLSFQRNWPTIGFNQYRDATAGNGKYLSTGYAAIQYFDPGSGTMAFDFFTAGSANFTTDPGRRLLTLYRHGSIGVNTGGSLDASLF